MPASGLPPARLWPASGLPLARFLIFYPYPFVPLPLALKRIAKLIWGLGWSKHYA